jgi:hypothetical protein
MSRARRATLEHLRKLAVGTAIVAACHTYAVSDPMPPPAKCSTNVQFEGQGVWVKSADGGNGLDLVLTLTSADPSFAAAFRALAVQPSGVIASSLIDARGHVVITLSGIATEATSVQLAIVYTVACEAGIDKRVMNIYWTSPPVAGRVEHISH